MVENKELSRLSEDQMVEIGCIAEVKGVARYLDPRSHIGFDIFNENVDEPSQVAPSLSQN